MAPLLIVDVPPLLDYPNHLARAYVLASLPGDPVLAQFYAPHWSVIPNLALDLIAPPLIQILPVHLVGRLMIAAALLVPTIGAIAYNTALGGRWWGLGAGLVAFNSCLLYGFLNFEISLGLALLLAAAWLRWREDHPTRTLVLAMAGASLLFACHLMGLVFFGLLIVGAELFHIGPAVLVLAKRPPSPAMTGKLMAAPPTRPESSAAALFRRGVFLALVFAAPAILYVASTLRQLGGDAEFLPISAKLVQLLTAFANYDRRLDMATALVAIILPALCLLLRLGRVPGAAAVPMVLLLIAFLAAPFAWKGTQSLDTRFAIMLAFMLFAGFVPVRWPPAFRVTAIAVLTLLFTARMALLTAAWAAHRTDLSDLRTVLLPVQPGQAVYVAEAGPHEAPAYWAANPNWRLLSNGVRTDEHLGALALIEHRAYWPFQFDNVSQQPMETREPYRTLAERVGGLPDRDEAAVANVCGFDYVLLTGADAVPKLPPSRFRLLTQSGYAALYAVTKCKEDP
ncbi:MAG TPA: hypothetical protein DDZ81_17785 [Acetobacteraceae bacterium]|nr:hypothetical protein [Acetobacteraceae bacterium]